MLWLHMFLTANKTLQKNTMHDWVTKVDLQPTPQEYIFIATVKFDFMVIQTTNLRHMVAMINTSIESRSTHPYFSR